MKLINKLYINGEWVDAKSKKVFTSNNPATGEKLAELPLAGSDEAKSSIQSANKAFELWNELTAFDRADLLYKLADMIEDNREELAELMTKEQGKPLYESRMEVEGSFKIFRLHAEEAKRINGEILQRMDNNKRNFVNQEPIGVVAAITPWNFP